MERKKHNEEIIAQFTKQASGYAAILSHSMALDKLIRITSASKKDTVLDVACGSGIVACEFAKHAHRVTGIDLTPEMLKQARKLQEKFRLDNLSWELGEVTSLPYPDGAFTIVVSRFGFHHFLNPGAVLAEMIRVCKPMGVVLVVDVALPESKIDQYNEMEKLRDTSHVAALSVEQFSSLFQKSGLHQIETDSYQMKIGLQEQLQASFPADSKKLKDMILQDVGIDNLGVKASHSDDGIFLQYPIHIFAGRKQQT
ncbi:MAG: class I SAM-dependent methyltransferase [Adhaeribacter sp.]